MESACTPNSRRLKVTPRSLLPLIFTLLPACAEPPRPACLISEPDERAAMLAEAAAEFGPADRAFAGAATDFAALAGPLERFRAGEVDEDAAVEELGAIRARMWGPWLAWRAASPEERATARTAHAEAWTSAHARLDAARDSIITARGGRIGFIGFGLAGVPQRANYEGEPPVTRVHGLYTYGFEVSSFEPEGRPGEHWWTGMSRDAQRQWEGCLGFFERNRLRSGAFSNFEFEAEGVLETGEGGYGHMSYYPAAFHIERLHSVRVLSDAEARAHFDARRAAAEQE